MAISHTLSGLVVSADARGAVCVWRPVAASASAAAQSSSAGEKPRTLCPQGGVAAIKAIAASPADVRVAPAALSRLVGNGRSARPGAKYICVYICIRIYVYMYICMYICISVYVYV